MSRKSPSIVSISDALEKLETLVGRTPDHDETDASWAATLEQAGNAGIYIVDYSGETEWERHAHGDEIVVLVEGETTLIMLVDGEEVSFPLGDMELVVVPQGVWHRFDTPKRSKILSVTPQPTDRSAERPSS